MRCKDKKKIYFFPTIIFFMPPPAGWYKLEGTRDCLLVAPKTSAEPSELEPCRELRKLSEKANAFALPKCSNVDEVRCRSVDEVKIYEIYSLYLI